MISRVNQPVARAVSILETGLETGLKTGETASSSAPDQLSLTPEEAQELQQWKQRYQPQLGNLLTPPVGNSSTTQAKAYVEQLVEQLSGPDLQKANIQLRVEVFSGDRPQIALDDADEQEKRWESRHPDQPWPIRSWLNVPKNGQDPLYRLVLSQGLLENLDTKEELAFVVAHEMARLLAHHAKDPQNEQTLKCNSQNWLDSHELQVGQDAAALAMMTRAKLNPEGALSALEKLYRKFPLLYKDPSQSTDPIRQDQATAIAAAVQGQEHEGIRIAVLQAQIEQMRRTGQASTTPSTPLSLQLPTTELAPYDVHVADFPKFQNQFINTAMSLSGETTPAWLLENKPPLEVRELRLTDACPQDWEKALVGLTQKLQNTPLTAQERVSSFLRTLLAIGEKALPSGFSEAGCAKIRIFLQDNADFQALSFCHSLSDEKHYLQRDFARKIQLNSSFEDIVGTALPELSMQAVPNFSRDPQTGTSDPMQVVQFLRLPSAQAYFPSAVKFVKELDPEQLIRQEDASGLSLGLVLCNKLRSLENIPLDFGLQLRQAMAPIQEKANSVRESQALVRLRPPLLQATKLDDYLQGLFQSEQATPFSPNFEKQLPALLKDVVLTCSQQKDLIFAESRPLELESGLERRLCAMLQSPEQDQVVRFMSRHWSHELRLPTHSPRRQWLAQLNQYYQSLDNQQLMQTLTVHDISQYSGYLANRLCQTYGLKAEEVADLSTAQLKLLDERRQAGEFTPKPEQFTDPAAYALARKNYEQQCRQLKVDSRFLAAAESRPVLAQLAMIGQDAENSQKIASKLNPDQFAAILGAAEAAVERSKTLRHLCNDPAVEVLGSDAGAFLIDGFLSNQENIPELERFWELATRTTSLAPAAIEARPATRERFASALFTRLQQLPGPQLREWLGKDNLIQSLKSQQTASLLLQVLGDEAKEGADIKQLALNIADLDQSLKLREKFPLVYSTLRDDVALQAKLQPSNVTTVFPDDEGNPIEQVSIFRNQIAALSGIVAMTRNHSAEDQLATIEFLLGRQADMPTFLEAAAEDQSLAPVAQALRNLRQELNEAEPIARIAVTNAFLAGPSGLLHRPGGKDALMAKLMQGVKPKFLAMADVMTRAILNSQGDTDTLAVAFVLGQKSKTGQESLSAADILNKVFDSYGVPGIKMKQYLAFTSEFADFREAFESAQDAAMPLSYYQIIKLINKRFGSDWPADLKIDKILGSGSVNLAIRYTDTRTGKREVVSLGRDAIEESTNYDFARFKKFCSSLTDTPENKAKFGYIDGLSHLIQESVKLEFDKESALKVQKLAYQSYKHQYKGWTIHSIDAFKVDRLGLFMEEAQGKTARKTLNQSPKLYQEAMRPMAKAEMSLIKGQLASGNLTPVPMFANPDFHDGQVLIDEPNKTVTILDFGQAVPISNEQRELALDLMTVLGKLDTPRQAVKRLNRRFFPSVEKGITLEELKSVLERPKIMDKFIHLLSLLSGKGADVPISTVHWVLAMNRQLVLGEKLDQSIKGQLAGMVINHKLGLPLGVFNTIYAANEKVKQVALGLAHSLVGWALPKEPELQTELFKSAPPEPQDRQWHNQDSWGWYPLDPDN